MGSPRSGLDGQPSPLICGQVMLGQVTPLAIRLLWFPHRRSFLFKTLRDLFQTKMSKMSNNLSFVKTSLFQLYLQQAKHCGGRNFLHVAIIKNCIILTDALLNAGRSIGKTYELCHDKMTGIRVFLNYNASVKCWQIPSDILG